MMKVGKLYEDITLDYFVVIKVLDTGKCGFECEIILSEDER